MANSRQTPGLGRGYYVRSLCTEAWPRVGRRSSGSRERKDCRETERRYRKQVASNQANLRGSQGVLYLVRHFTARRLRTKYWYGVRPKQLHGGGKTATTRASKDNSDTYYMRKLSGSRRAHLSKPHDRKHPINDAAAKIPAIRTRACVLNYLGGLVALCVFRSCCRAKTIFYLDILYGWLKRPFDGSNQTTTKPAANWMGSPPTTPRTQCPLMPAAAVAALCIKHS